MSAFVKEAKRLAKRDVGMGYKKWKHIESRRAQKAAVWLDMFGAEDLVEHLASLKGMTANPGSLQ